jgi:CO/xanthine dehydrogenase Mo-binding subunit
VTLEALSASLAAHPDLDRWLRVEADGSVSAFTGKVEIGQGLLHALARIVAEELSLPVERVRVHAADTARGPDEFVTAGSMSLEQGGNALRHAAAEARLALLENAAEHLGVHVSTLEIEDGRVRDPASGNALDYAAVMRGRRFDRTISGSAPLVDPKAYRVLGRSGPNRDLVEKLRGGEFLHDLRPEGLLFGRVLRPPALDARVGAIDLEVARRMDGVVAVVRDGSFVGVVAEREEQAIAAREALASSVEWVDRKDGDADTVSLGADYAAFMERQPRISHAVIERAAIDRPPERYRVPPGATKTLEARFARPFLLHGAIGPSAALALEESGRLQIWTHSQSIGPTRDAIAHALGRSPDTVRLMHRPGPGCYGHNGADDVALDAALLADAVPGRPVLLQWTREDEHLWEPYGPAMLVDMKAALDDEGRLAAWSHEVTSFTHVSRPIFPDSGPHLSATWLRDPPLPRPAVVPLMRTEIGEFRNATPYYEIPEIRVVRHLLTTQPLRTSSLRGLGAFVNVFAIESMMDELAEAAGRDPLEFRLRHLRDPRAREVLETAASKAGWSPRTRRQGIAFARYENQKAYAAVVVTVEVGEDDKIHLEHCVIAADAGEIVDPDGLASQLEGGVVQAASWTLFEELRVEDGRVRSVDWESYPTLPFAEVPTLETHLIPRPGTPFLGAGEATQGPTPAAIANAVFRATGLRLRQTPFTPERLRQARQRRGPVPEAKTTARPRPHRLSISAGPVQNGARRTRHGKDESSGICGAGSHRVGGQGDPQPGAE